MSLPFQEIAVSALILLLVFVFVPGDLGYDKSIKLSVEADLNALTAIKTELNLTESSAPDQIQAALQARDEFIKAQRFQGNLFFKAGIWAVLILFYFFVLPNLFIEPSKEKYVEATKKILKKGFKEKIISQLHSQYGFSVSGFKLSFDLLDDWRNAVVRLNKFIIEKKKNKLGFEERIQHQIELISFVDMEKETVLCYPKSFDVHQLETGKINLLDISRVYSKPIGFDYKLYEQLEEKLNKLEVGK